MSEKLELKPFDAENQEILKKEWEYIRDIAENENGFTNNAFGISWEGFMNEYVPKRIMFSTGKNLPEGFVPQTDYLLWADDKIVGMFRVRPVLNDFLRNKDGGHIGYGIVPECRGKGFASQGLKLALEELKKLSADDQAILFVHKDNPASLRVMQKNGGSVVGETEENFKVQIKLL